MSSTFVELGSIVLAAFGLGVFVGWLAWSTVPVAMPAAIDREATAAAPGAGRSSDVGVDVDADADRPEDTDVLPQWWAERIPTAELQLRTHRFRPGKREPTVMVRPRGWTPVRRR